MAKLIPLLPMAALEEGDMVQVSAAGRTLLLCQVEGQFYALADQCSHAQQSLSRGRLHGYQVSCPLHGARFDVRSGACLAAPASEPVQTFPVVLEGGKVCVAL
ncbi:MAG: Rieske (2Fe-2S) protein [Pseudomonadales bacterium]